MSEHIWSPRSLGLSTAFTGRRIHAIRIGAPGVLSGVSTWSSPPAAEAAKRTQSRMVNFGVAAVARVTGVATDQLLELRCECGAAGCRERVRIARGVYGALTEADLLVVSSLHGASAGGRAEGWVAVTHLPEGRIARRRPAAG